LLTLVGMCGVLALGACGQSDDLAYLALRVHSPAQPTGSLRRFPPYLPAPLDVHVQVFKSSDLLGRPAADVDVAWDDLEIDPDSGSRYLLVGVTSNAGKNFSYVLKLESIVGDGSGGLIVDECGVVGQITAEPGAKVALDISTHLEECSRLLCQHDTDCVGESRYCLSFECQDRATCDQCPPGANCDDFNWCASACEQATDCEDGFGCCHGICSASCPDG
jgi:hypothetical protein